ncbi:choice-of-anchor D domain-containing protein [Gracilimonas sediminicola]|uniref:Choice-of-anchor D domain-containing protein n=1 Tax=Gracilimonas sediminicola TaxID=2952158 RepID=A0A9X2L1D6_9BACT|nr:choice-of-anchor D domain-containing protein [Gracilimonas sediminicola]MCP9290492.1 choice-of-anchor D domain-containing protein [Gracilimonas sediminicola]
MYFIKTFFLTLSIALLTFSYTFAQNDRDPAQYNKVILDNEDFKRICTLTSTGEDVHYQLSHQQFNSRKKSGKKGASIQVDYIARPSWPDEAVEAFDYAVEIWETYLDSDIPIRIQANWTQLGEFTLGSAGPSQIVQLEGDAEATWYSIAQGSAISGIDFVAQSQGTNSEVDHDVIVNMNAGWDNWYFGTDAQTPDGLIDFVTVVLHEIGHGIGFTGSMQVPTGQTAQWGYGAPPIPIVYDRFVIDSDGAQIIDQQVYRSPSGKLYDAVTSKTGGIFFAGINTIGTYDGQAAPLYAPSEWNGGSSYSHLDLATFTNTENALMRPQIDRAFAIHTPGPVMCSIFGDMGWPLAENCQNLLGTESEITVNQVLDNSIDFGVTNVGSNVERTFSISNGVNAADPLVGRVGVSGSNSFTFSNSNQIFTLDPGESTNITVRFEPGVEGEVAGVLEIAHNGSEGQNPVMISLGGEALPEDEVFVLDQNYPNPFNATTTIPYALAQSADVRLDVFDALGKHVQTLVNTRQPSGRYNQPFQADDVSSGLFIYRLIVDGKSKTGKLLLVK